MAGRAAGAGPEGGAGVVAGGQGGADAVEDDEGADLAGDRLETQDAHGRGAPRPRARGAPRQALAPGAVVRAPRAEDDAPDGTATTVAGLARALVDVQVLLHLSVALRGRVVVDGAAATLDRLAQHAADGLVEAALVRRAQRIGPGQRVEPGPPEGPAGGAVARGRGG